MNKYLSVGKDYTKRASTLCMSSPFAYVGDKSREKIFDIYREAIDFSIKHICHSKDKEGDCIYHII